MWEGTGGLASLKSSLQSGQANSPNERGTRPLTTSPAVPDSLGIEDHLTHMRGLVCGWERARSNIQKRTSVNSAEKSIS